MKKITERKIEQVRKFRSTAIIDRRIKKETAVLAEQRMITKECSGNVMPAYLYNYYVMICTIPSWDLTDDSKVAKELGLTPRKVGDTRRLLTKLGWIKLVVRKIDGMMWGSWYIGKEVVSAAGDDAELSISDWNRLGVIDDETYEIAKEYEEVSNG